jgi:hypothetical protein
MKKKTVYTLNVGDQEYEDLEGNFFIFIKLCVESQTWGLQTIYIHLKMHSVLFLLVVVLNSETNYLRTAHIFLPIRF